MAGWDTWPSLEDQIENLSLSTTLFSVLYVFKHIKLDRNEYEDEKRTSLCKMSSKTDKKDTEYVQKYLSYYIRQRCQQFFSSCFF